MIFAIYKLLVMCFGVFYVFSKPNHGRYSPYKLVYSPYSLLISPYSLAYTHFTRLTAYFTIRWTKYLPNFRKSNFL